MPDSLMNVKSKLNIKLYSVFVTHGNMIQRRLDGQLEAFMLAIGLIFK